MFLERVVNDTRLRVRIRKRLTKVLFNLFKGLHCSSTVSMADTRFRFFSANWDKYKSSTGNPLYEISLFVKEFMRSVTHMGLFFSQLAVMAENKYWASKFFFFCSSVIQEGISFLILSIWILSLAYSLDGISWDKCRFLGSSWHCVNAEIVFGLVKSSSKKTLLEAAKACLALLGMASQTRT